MKMKMSSGAINVQLSTERRMEWVDGCCVPADSDELEDLQYFNMARARQASPSSIMTTTYSSSRGPRKWMLTGASGPTAGNRTGGNANEARENVR